MSYLVHGFSCGSAGKESACSAGDLGLIPGLGRSPREGKGYPLQYSGLENSVDSIVHGVAKSWTRLSDFHFWRSKWQPTPIFFPREFHGQRRLVGYNPCGCKESDTTESGLALPSSPYAHFTWEEIETHTLIIWIKLFWGSNMLQGKENPSGAILLWHLVPARTWGNQFTFLGLLFLFSHIGTAII